MFHVGYRFGGVQVAHLVGAVGKREYLEFLQSVHHVYGLVASEFPQGMGEAVAQDFLAFRLDFAHQFPGEIVPLWLFLKGKITFQCVANHGQNIGHDDRAL